MKVKGERAYIHFKVHSCSGTQKIISNRKVVMSSDQPKKGYSLNATSLYVVLFYEKMLHREFEIDIAGAIYPSAHQNEASYLSILLGRNSSFKQQ